MSTVAPKLSKEQVKAFIKDNDLKSMADVQSALKELFADTLQEMLKAELDHELRYPKHDVTNKKTSNSRNGKSKKTIVSEYREQEIRVPRDPTVSLSRSSLRSINRMLLALKSKSLRGMQRGKHAGYPEGSVKWNVEPLKSIKMGHTKFQAIIFWREDQ